MKKHITKHFLIFGFATYGVIWTVVESTSFFLKLEPKGWCLYASMILASGAVAVWRAWPKNSIELQVPNSDSSIVIEFGDIFKHEGYIAIPVNEFFDSELGDHVSPNTLHGMFIRDILGGQSSAFNTLVSNALSGHSYTSEPRQTGRSNKYPIGTTASVDINSRRFLLFALAHTNLATLKASANIHDLWDALAGLWEGVRNYSNGHVVAVPLAGGGAAGVGLPPKNILDVIVMSYFYYTKKNKIAKQVKVILPVDLKDKIDLLSYSENWS